MAGSTELKEGNDQSGKGAPRRGRRRDNWRHYTVIVVGLAVVYGAAATLGAYVRSGKADAVVAPADATGPAGKTKLALPVKPTVPVTLTVYEDLGSPASRAFAQRYADTFTQLLASGQVQIDYRLVTQSDKQYGGNGAKAAAAAAACAQDQGRFTQFVDQVWQHQSDLAHDGLGNRKLLFALAKKAGKINEGTFRSCVETGERQGWVAASQAEFAAAALGDDAPVVTVNEVPVPGAGTSLTPKKLRALVQKEAQRVADQKVSERSATATTVASGPST
ncbi:DsbA family protein [Streptomyces celluloflavus]|uniref:DsbA family protein n=1 Tax=Streptomyces celluloflavus TaxID=58344 RepID=UPI0036C772E9